ncbi:MAG TPA: thioesterase family protein [Trueperaceae bacterium]|nr:thioesterase family protein [Trueperaceae bacterium]
MTPATTDLDLKELIEETIPFNKLLGVKLVSADHATLTVVLRLPLRHDLVGNVVRGMPHGGTIAALIDAAAGAAAALSLENLRDAPGVATIDMRVDYLAPGRGTELLASATVKRAGRRVTVVRVDVTDSDAQLIALGTAAFSVELRGTDRKGEAV